MGRISEEDLVKQGFKKIKANYSGRCNFCKQPYSAGEEIYWKREPTTTVCCPRCYGVGRIKAVCPNCGTEFFVAHG